MAHSGVQDPPFLKLPAELRNRIYHEEVSKPKTMIAKHRGRCCFPPLLQVCQRIRSEASSIYYSNNFTFEPDMRGKWVEGLVNWLSSLEQRNTLRIKHIRIAKHMYPITFLPKQDISTRIAELERVYVGLAERGVHVSKRIMLVDVFIHDEIRERCCKTRGCKGRAHRRNLPELMAIKEAMPANLTRAQAAD